MGTKTLALQRVKAEYEDLANNQVPSMIVMSTNPLQWDGELIGPEGTPYANQKFHFTILFPESYPFHPPEFRFRDPKVYHPNIMIGDQDGGMVHIRMLKTWTDTCSARQLLTFVYEHFVKPDLFCIGNNPEAALNYRDNPQLYAQRVQEFIGAR